MASIDVPAGEAKRLHADLTSRSTEIQTLNVLLPTYSFGGHERMLLEWLKEVERQKGIEIHIYCRDIPELTRECASTGLNVNVEVFGGNNQQGRLCKAISDLANTSRILRKIPRGKLVLFAPGVVQSAPWHSLVASLLGFGVANYVPMAYKSRDMCLRYAWLRDWIVRQFIRYSDIWITITEQQRRLLVDHWRISAPIHVVPNRHKLPFITSSVQRNSPDENRPTRVLFLGRFEPNQKGLDWLIEEMRRYRASWLGRMHFVFQGQGEYEQSLRQLASEMPHGVMSIAPWGNVSHELQQADVLFLPSRFEGFPLVAVEAAHYGVPIVASDKAGLTDVLMSECIFPFGDFGALITSLNRIRDPIIRSSAASFTLRRIQNLLSRDKFEKSVSDLIRDFDTRTVIKQPLALYCDSSP